jgi:hypothetical protein
MSMELSAPQFLQVLGEVTTLGREVERRHSPRIAADANVAIATVYAGRRSAPQVAKLHDLGRGGLGLRLDTEMPPGTQFFAYLPRRNADALEVRCQVRQCHAAEDHGYVVGAEFQRTSLAIPVRPQFEKRAIAA